VQILKFLRALRVKSESLCNRKNIFHSAIAMAAESLMPSFQFWSTTNQGHGVECFFSLKFSAKRKVWGMQAKK
jgi:hypothetical protein